MDTHETETLSLPSVAAGKPAKSRLGYIPTLDGWRAVAIIAVLLNHDLSWWPTSLLHQFGRQGVDLFFALSGILICTRLLEEEKISGKISLRNFYIRRIFRIQPAALVYLACICLLTAFGVLSHTFGGVRASLLMVRNYFQPHQGDDWYTAHFWSLSVEEHFYLLLPGFLILVKKHRVTLLLAIVVALKSWQMLLRRHPDLPPNLASSLRTEAAAIGILLAAVVALLLMRPRFRAWCQSWIHPYPALVLTCLIWLASDKVQSVTGWFDFAMLLAYPLLIVSTVLHPANLIGRALESAPLRFLGRISYSVYLWQMIFFCFGYGVPAPHSPLIAHIQTSLLRYPVTLAVSLFSYYVIEKPMVRLGHRLAKSVVPGRGSSAVLPKSA
jgi:peptidoglycan/LPS O-acetylase OafA/YrhL